MWVRWGSRFQASSMEEALWQVAPDAGVASASLVGGSLAKVLDGLGPLAQMGVV